MLCIYPFPHVCTVCPSLASSPSLHKLIIVQLWLCNRSRTQDYICAMVSLSLWVSMCPSCSDGQSHDYEATVNCMCHVLCSCGTTLCLTVCWPPCRKRLLLARTHACMHTYMVTVEYTSTLNSRVSQHEQRGQMTCNCIGCSPLSGVDWCLDSLGDDQLSRGHLWSSIL